MPKVLLSTVVMVLLAAPVQAREPAASSDFRSIVPRDWTLLPRAESPHERRFVSPNGDAWLALYARPSDREPVRAYMDHVKAATGGNITYERVGQGWIVVSGYRGDRIYYEKAMLACGNGEWHHLEFEYPGAQKRAFDRFVTRASYALKAYKHAGCGH